MSKAVRIAACGWAVSVFAQGAWAQWSSDPANPLRIADASGDQALPVLATTSDGGCYVAWNDNRAGGYSAYLQRLDPAGVELWADNGILLATGTNSATSFYSIITDSLGNAVVAYQDDGGVSGSTVQVSVSKVAPSGALIWKKTITTGTMARGAPVVAELSDGSLVVGYNNTNTSPFSWGMQRLDASGDIQWGPAGIDVLEAGHYALLSDVKATGTGFVVSWVRGSGASATTSNKGIYTQRYDVNGAAQWNSGNPVIVFAGNSTASMQNGYFPPILSDGAGGAVYGWYEISGVRNAYIQHVLADGSFKFPAPVSNANTPTSRIRIGAALAYDTATGDYYLASPESSAPTQGNYSVFVQKLDSTGARVWGDTGVLLQPQDNTGPQASFVQCLLMGGGVMTAWNWGGGPLAGSTRAALTTGGGSPTTPWNQAVSTQNIVQTRLKSARTPSGAAILAFGFGPFGSADIAGVRINADGTLGPPPACYGNCDASTAAPVLNVGDFTCFLQKYASSDPYANCDGSTAEPTLNVGDFTCFLQKYAAGCV